MKVAILGSGFGLYCYLPAILIGCGQQVTLPDRYRDRLRMRADVGHLFQSVEWAASDDSMLDSADAVVISQRPADQVERAPDCLRRTNIQSLILEKPIAPDPGQAIRLLDQIERSGKRFCIGYTFKYTEWGRALLDCVRDLISPVTIRWSFRAHHYATSAHNWKRSVSNGGGAVRFYGIHLIALLAEAGYDRVIMSMVKAEKRGEAETWYAVLHGTDLPECHLEVDTNCANENFFILARHASTNVPFTFVLREPFALHHVSNDFDHRVSFITMLCSELFSRDRPCSSHYRKSIELWSKVEADSKVEFAPIIRA
jgi:predicted dehydrogenase